MAKIRYIETKPIQQILEFVDNQEYYKFFEKRIKEIMDYTYPNNLNFYEYYQYNKILLNKNGKPRKSINPKWLHTKETHKKQRKNWLIYCEKRKKQTIETTYRRKKAEIERKINFWKNELQELEKQQGDKNGNQR